MIVESQPAKFETVAKQELLCMLQDMFCMLVERGMPPDNIQIHVNMCMYAPLTAMFGTAVTIDHHNIPILMNNDIVVTSDASDIWMLNKDHT